MGNVKERTWINEWYDLAQQIEYEMDRGYGTVLDADADEIDSLHDSLQQKLHQMRFFAHKQANEVRSKRGSID